MTERDRMCLNKHRYATRAEAKAAMELYPEVQYRCYRCPYSVGSVHFHLTKGKWDIKWKDQRRKA